MNLSNLIKNSIIIIIIILIGHFYMLNNIKYTENYDDTCNINLDNSIIKGFKKNIKENCNIIQDKNVLILNKYYDENDMNNSDIEPSGFDKFDFTL